MSGATRWARVLVMLGLLAMVVGALDPMEGSVLILAGAAMVAGGATLAHSRRRKLAYLSLALVAVGVAALVGFSAVGGFGGTTGRPIWLGVLLTLPYLVGWVIGLVAAVRCLCEKPMHGVLLPR